MKPSQLENIVSATQALQVALADLPALAALRIDDCLKAAIDRAVFQAELGGDAVIVKLSHGEGAAQDVAAQAEELRFHRKRMADGPYRVPGLIAAMPDRGLLVMTFAPGLRLIDAMKERNGGDRYVLAAKAGRWLAYLTAERRRQAPLAAGYWRKRIGKLQGDAKSIEDRRLLGALGHWMETRMPDLGGVATTQVRGHGDFCPLNLIVDGDVLYGVDLQSSRWFALERDLARYLVVSAIGHGPAAASRLGIDGDEMQALVSAPGLIAAAEAERVLPFFLACELGGRLISEAHKPRSREKLQQMIGEFLAVAQ